MTLIDAGPLLALLNKNDPYRADARRAAATLRSGMLLSTWPAFTEAMYLLGRRVGYSGQEALWSWLSGGRMRLWEPTPADVVRMSDLMKIYRNVPMDLADASLVA